MRISPLLQEKYARQKAEYRQTKHLSTSEYIRWKEKRSEELVRRLGYVRKKIRLGVCRLVKA